MRNTRTVELEIKVPNGNYLIVPLPYLKDISRDVSMSIYYNCKPNEILIADANDRANPEEIKNEFEYSNEQFPLGFKQYVRNVITEK